MSKRIQALWTAYAIIFLFSAGQRAYEFFAPGSSIHFYYQLAIGLDIAFLLPYTLNLAQILLNLLHALPLLGYIYRIPVLSPRFWQIMLAFRLILDLFGHSYDSKFYISIYHYEPWVTAAALGYVVSIHFPSYFACYRYAFQGGNIIPSDKKS